MLTEAELAKVREAWSTVERISPDAPAYLKCLTWLDARSQDELKQLAKAKIKFISVLAYNRIKQDTWAEAFSLPRKAKRKSQIGVQREMMFGSRRFIYEKETSRQWSGYFDDNHAITYVQPTKAELLEDAATEAFHADIEAKGGDIDEIRTADRVLS